MSLAASIQSDIAHQLGGPVVSIRVVSGGDIHRAFHVQLGNGRALFVKTSDDTPPELFEAETQGLAWLASFEALPVPTVAAYRDNGPKGPGYLALQWHAPLPRGGRHHGAAFGRGLAELHSHVQPRPGWRRDVFIGPLPQCNDDSDDSARTSIGDAWASFWVERRLRPMMRLAARGLDGTAERLLDDVCAACPTLLGQVDHLGPLHGDLWGGNALWTADGGMLIDPAVYAGDPEVDLAMMALFGGFGPDVWQAYFDVRPKRAGFEARCALYQLWPLLVHVTLFGGGYSGQTTQAAKAVLGAV